MRRSRSGFTLVEVMITVVILFVVLDALMLFFLNVVGEFRKQGKVAETGIETVIGLEVLRKDVESAGYGLPWTNIPTYSESATANAADDSPSNAPRALVNQNGVGINGSDRLVVKASSVGTDEACRKFTTLQEGPFKRTWGNATLDFSSTDRVLVLGAGTDPANRRWYLGPATFSSGPLTYATADGYAPSAPEVRLIYGLTDGTVPRMPFNRAEYFIDQTSVPRLCAPGTGVLAKSVMLHDSGSLGAPLPLLDCVLDFQVALGLNLAGTDPTVDCVVASTSHLDNTAPWLRERLRDVRISILSHEGARDARYVHPESSIFVGDNSLATPVGATVNVGALRNYRWKVHTIVVRPTSLR